jgi:DNA modification methylase
MRNVIDKTDQTVHRVIVADARRLDGCADESVDLVVTSPPYPMIQMWDEQFTRLCPEIGVSLEAGCSGRAFELMHRELDKVWNELYRVLKNGAFACINIGDATRTIGGSFQLFSNHSRILSCCRAIGFDTLPVILWRKQTNAPNKFMGSGMLPAGAYVTLEHEYILIVRKGSKRIFTSEAAKLKRMQSAYFWEERNNWFSDLWDFKGIRQQLQQQALRERSAAFPFELAWRLIAMYSCYGDTVLDPFVGTGTTMMAAMASGRCSTGVDIDRSLAALAAAQLERCLDDVNHVISERLQKHLEFVENRTAEKKTLKYVNNRHGFPVMTKQETELLLKRCVAISQCDPMSVMVTHEKLGCLNTEKQWRSALKQIEGQSFQQTCLDI